MRKFVGVLVLSFGFSPALHASVIAYNSKSLFIETVGEPLVTQDWSTYDADTLLDGQLLDAITYNSTSTEQLVVGRPHGANWILGYKRPTGYASFSTETISFEFEDAIEVFGISLSQGNRNQGDNYAGLSLWSIVIDGRVEFTSRADYDPSDFTGEAYLGLDGLNGASRIDVHRISSSAPIVWDIREISYRTPSPVPLPAAAWLFISAIAGLAGAKRLSRSKGSA
jgi:hypothetical protein